MEYKLLVCLRILGRGNTYDDVSEVSRIGLSTIANILKTFVAFFTKSCYGERIFPPTGPELEKIHGSL